MGDSRLYILREYIEFPLMFVWTFMLPPAVIGFLLGRYAPTIIRCACVIPILMAGYWMCQYSDHNAEGFFRGNFIYVGATLLGLHYRGQKQGKRLKDFYHLDWMAVAGANIVFVLMYTRPSA